MTLLEDIKQKVNAFQIEKDELLSELHQKFPSFIVPLMKKYNNEAAISMIEPQIESIAWTQYTPYFNDGDVCEFGRNSDLYINGNYADEMEAYRYASQREGNPNELEKTIDQIKDILEDIPESFYRDMFGDHCKVWIFADGKLDVEEYEHE